MAGFIAGKARLCRAGLSVASFFKVEDLTRFIGLDHDTVSTVRCDAHVSVGSVRVVFLKLIFDITIFIASVSVQEVSIVAFFLT